MADYIDREKLLAEVERILTRHCAGGNVIHNDWNNAAEYALRLIRSAPSEKPSLHVELPQGDGRTVTVWWTEMRDGKLHACISVSDSQQPVDLDDSWQDRFEKLVGYLMGITTIENYPTVVGKVVGDALRYAEKLTPVGSRTRELVNELCGPSSPCDLNVCSDKPLRSKEYAPYQMSPSVDHVAREVAGNKNWERRPSPASEPQQPAAPDVTALVAERDAARKELAKVQRDFDEYMKAEAELFGVDMEEYALPAEHGNDGLRRASLIALKQIELRESVEAMASELADARAEVERLTNCWRSSENDLQIALNQRGGGTPSHHGPPGGSRGVE